ncbi:CU044_5270 family protein [Actinoallomurus vinaceus]|uniref:CU044_5270 family protein n=1 Tax=Actinoallomurus vinaceus TaxID=1080074 RepID=A0ABP8UNW2_9ACTN
MDELTMLATALRGSEPSQEAADRSRHRLQNTMRGGPARKRRIGWLAGGLGLTAATAATAILVSTTGTAHTAHPNSPPSTAAPSTLSARQILLAAATTAENAPAASGTYWYVKMEEKESANDKPTLRERWTRRDGEVWRRDAKTEGEVFHQGILPDRPKGRPFDLGVGFVSLQQIQELPTEADRLKAWLADTVAHSGIRTGAGPLTAQMQKEYVFESLYMLISTLPAPPKVRAAAFRAFAAYPNVKVVGKVADGEALQFSVLPGDRLRMVIDPKTSQVRETNFLAEGGGGEFFSDGGGVRITTAAWTNDLPH